MSEPWRIYVTEYHGRAEARVARPHRTLFRKRLVWRRLTYVGSASPGNWRSAKDNVVSYALNHIPASADYEVVVREEPNL